MLKQGDKAPAFTLMNDKGKKTSLKDVKGIVALYFYPKDFTSGCTKQACSLRDGFDVLKKKGIKIIGISPDDATSHAKFVSKYELPFGLLADTKKTVAEKYGVWVEKNMYGRKYMGIKRTTFLIKNGKILDVIKKVDVKQHPGQILERLN
jgi:peroxiredoxin Q/BCP